MRNIICFFLVVLVSGNLYGKTADPQKKGLSGDIFFAVNSATLTDEAKTILDSMADFLKSNSDKNILIEGYCDKSGSASSNYKLGLDRANSVRNYLFNQGIAQRRMDVVSYGEKKADAGPSGEKEQKLYRRVTIKIK